MAQIPLSSSAGGGFVFSATWATGETKSFLFGPLSPGDLPTELLVNLSINTVEVDRAATVSLYALSNQPSGDAAISNGRPLLLEVMVRPSVGSSVGPITPFTHRIPLPRLNISERYLGLVVDDLAGEGFRGWIALRVDFARSPDQL